MATLLPMRIATSFGERNRADSRRPKSRQSVYGHPHSIASYDTFRGLSSGRRGAHVPGSDPAALRDASMDSSHLRTAGEAARWLAAHSDEHSRP
jgi:hypothetical protein